MSRNTGPGLYEFLMEAELQQYYPGIRGMNFNNVIERSSKELQMTYHSI